MKLLSALRVFRWRKKRLKYPHLFIHIWTNFLLTSSPRNYLIESTSFEPNQFILFLFGWLILYVLATLFGGSKTGFKIKSEAVWSAVSQVYSVTLCDHDVYRYINGPNGWFSSSWWPSMWLTLKVKLSIWVGSM